MPGGESPGACHPHIYACVLAGGAGCACLGAGRYDQDGDGLEVGEIASTVITGALAAIGASCYMPRDDNDDEDSDDESSDDESSDDESSDESESE